jgi:hypothetical protein
MDYTRNVALLLTALGLLALPVHAGRERQSVRLTHRRGSGFYRARCTHRFTNGWHRGWCGPGPDVQQLDKQQRGERQGRACRPLLLLHAGFGLELRPRYAGLYTGEPR